LVIGPRWQGQWTEYCAAALRSLGHQTQMIYYDRAVEDHILAAQLRLPNGVLRKSFGAVDKRWLSLISRRTVRQVKSFAPDLVLLLKGDLLAPEFLAEIKHLAGAKLVTWWLDDPFRFRDFIPALDLIDNFFIFDRSYIPALLEHGAKAATYLPCACAIDVLRPLGLSAADRQQYGSQVSFVGCHYPQREAILSALESFELGIWGPGWRRNLPADRTALRSAYRGWATPQQAVKIYNASATCLNIHHQQTRDGGLNFRTFELAACGAFQLVDYVPGLEDLFVPGAEIVCFHEVAELCQQVRYYLDHPAERASIAARGHQRLERDHTIHVRMKTILKTVSLQTGHRLS
jgi:spore maturation protein CgeB